MSWELVAPLAALLTAAANLYLNFAGRKADPAVTELATSVRNMSTDSRNNIKLVGARFEHTQAQMDRLMDLLEQRLRDE